jgi:hypothetical protein
VVIVHKNKHTAHPQHRDVALFCSWPSCQNGRENTSDARWREVASSYLAMHTRYPKDARFEADGTTPRANRLIEAFFEECRHAGCVPEEGRDLLEYELGDGQQARSEVTHR